MLKRLPTPADVEASVRPRTKPSCTAHKDTVPNIPFITAIRRPGISRTLTLAFSVVILVVALTLPVSIFAFKRISAASEEARLSSVMVQSTSEFSKKISDVKTSSRDYAQHPNNTRIQRKITTTLQDAIDIALCVSNSHASVCSENNLDLGIKLPESEARQWDEVRKSAALAKDQFETDVQSDPSKAVKSFDSALAKNVDTRAAKLTSDVADRGVDAQSSINDAIYQSMAMIVAVLAFALLLAIALATIVPMRFMKRLDHLRGVAHRLAEGELNARADTKYAVRVDEIGDVICDFNIMALGLQQQDSELRQVQGQLQEMLRQETDRATRDPLTGLRNHRYFQENLHKEIERCRRNGSQVTISAIDLDNFKQVNDRFGHSEGDAVLRRATKCISENLRPYDLACRLGGEEFGIIFADATAEQAKSVLDRIAAQMMPLGPNGEKLTFSAGVATWPLHANTQSELFQRADESSYMAKMNGKAQSVIYDPLKVSSMDSNERSKQRSRDAILTTATALVSAVDQKDPYTQNHSELVAVYAATIARALNLDEPTVKLVYRAGLLHDVGKIGISDSILVKNGELTHDEWVQLRTHPEFSYRILLAADLEPVATWTRHHHEHIDGTGYPLGLSGEDIPLGSRIVLVADAFESMTSDRVYRRALGIAQALDELRAGAGHQFDAQVVAAMIDLVNAGVFTQVMQQYGRVTQYQAVDEFGNQVNHDPAAIAAAVASASLDGVPPSVNNMMEVSPTAASHRASEQAEATAWAQKTISDAPAPEVIPIEQEINTTDTTYAPWAAAASNDDLPPTYQPPSQAA